MTETFLVAELDAEGEYGIEVRDVLVDWIGEVEGCRLDGRPRLPAIQDGHALTGIKTSRGEHDDEGEPVTPGAERERGHGDLGHSRRTIDERGHNGRDIGPVGLQVHRSRVGSRQQAQRHWHTTQDGLRGERRGAKDRHVVEECGADGDGERVRRREDVGGRGVDPETEARRRARDRSDIPAHGIRREGDSARVRGIRLERSGESSSGQSEAAEKNGQERSQDDVPAH